MRRALKVGDAVSYRVGGRRMRAVVSEYLPMRSPGEESLVLITKRNAGRVYWMPRSEVRKLPPPR
jgi:hypothetical protein